MHDDKGYTDHITLHQGTIINPTGIRLVEGMHITVYGNADGPTFQANQIDVSPPQQYAYGGSGGAFYPGGGYGGGGYYPYGGYGGYGNPYYGYGYGGYPYGWGWPWGWGFGLGVNWGWGWGWGGGYPYGYGAGCCYRGGGGFVRPPVRGGGSGSIHGTVTGRPPRR